MKLNQLYPKKDILRMDITKKIGSGAYGNVYLLKNSENILKVLNIKTKKNKTIRPREIKNIFVIIYFMTKYPKLLEIMPNISSFGFITENNMLKSFYLIMNNCGMELGKYLEENPNISTKEIFKIFLKIIKAVKMIHKRKILHRDIKPENIMVKLDKSDNISKLYVIDFGFMGHLTLNLTKDFKSKFSGTNTKLQQLKEIISKFNGDTLFKEFRFLDNNEIDSDCKRNPDLDNNHYAKKYSCLGKTRMETFHYASPEHHATYRDECTHLKEELIGAPHDVYALGVLFMEMLCGYCQPFKHNREKLLEYTCQDTQNDIKSEFKFFMKRLTPELNKIFSDDNKHKKIVTYLVFGMLRQHPGKRLTLKKIISVLKPFLKKKTKKKTNKNKKYIFSRKKKIYPIKLRISSSNKKLKNKNSIDRKYFGVKRKNTLKKPILNGSDLIIS